MLTEEQLRKVVLEIVARTPLGAYGADFACGVARHWYQLIATLRKRLQELGIEAIPSQRTKNSSDSELLRLSGEDIEVVVLSSFRDGATVWHFDLGVRSAYDDDYILDHLMPVFERWCDDYVQQVSERFGVKASKPPIRHWPPFDDAT